ncbi:hypothetical protein N9F34_05215 [Alphaproteobacteria bacterium]|nr:hypothetical protein [Alphaproteobacteria bacterium]
MTYGADGVWSDQGFSGAPHWCFGGGSWFDEPGDLRSSDRSGLWTDSRFDIFGFRVARTLP